MAGDSREQRSADSILPIDLYEILDEVRPRPGMYIGSRSLRDVRAWIEGLRFGCERAGVRLTSEPDFYHFHRLVQKRLGFDESTSGWCNMLCERTPEPDATGAALTRFWEMLDELRALGPARHVAEMADAARITKTCATGAGAWPKRLDLFVLPAPIGWFWYRDHTWGPDYVLTPELAYEQADRCYGVPRDAWRDIV